jgi:hypothetical protein
MTSNPQHHQNAYPSLRGRLGLGRMAQGLHSRQALISTDQSRVTSALANGNVQNGRPTPFSPATIPYPCTNGIPS